MNFDIKKSYSIFLEEENIKLNLKQFSLDFINFVKNNEKYFKNTELYQSALNLVISLQFSFDNPDLINKLTDISNMLDSKYLDKYENELDNLFKTIDLDIQLKEMFDYLDKNKIEYSYLLTENLSYYDLRLFVTILFKKTEDPLLKKISIELLKTLAKLEIQKVPIPVIKKLRSKSPIIFK